MSPHLLCIGGVDHALRVPFFQALRERGFRVTAAATAEPAPFLRAGIDYHRFRFDRFTNPLADWTAIGTIAKLMVDVRPHLVQSFDTKPNLLVPIAARRVPNALVVRTINGLAWTYSSRSPLALAVRPFYRALHRLADRTTAAAIFQNRDDRAFFERHGMVGSGRSRLIPGSGADAQGFAQAKAMGPSSAELRQELGLGTAEVVITVTRMTRQKGIPALLEAAALVHAVRPGVRFLLVGPRESEGRLAVSQAAIDRHAPYVLALGRRSDIPSLLGTADVFAFPTEYREGVPRVLLEAALAGLPIVTTDMPGCNDVVRHGETGLVVPPRNSAALADGIVALLQNQEWAKSLAVRAAALVNTEFSLGFVVERYADLYHEIIARSRPGTSMRSVGEGAAAADWSVAAPSAAGEIATSQ